MGTYVGILRLVCRPSTAGATNQLQYRNCAIPPHLVGAVVEQNFGQRDDFFLFNSRSSVLSYQGTILSA